MEIIPGMATVARNALIYLDHGGEKRMIGHCDQGESGEAGVDVRVVLVCLRYSGRLPEIRDGNAFYYKNFSIFCGGLKLRNCRHRSSGYNPS